LLVAAVALTVTRIYMLWQEGPWDLPGPGNVKSSEAVEGSEDEPEESQGPQLAGTKNIIEKNLFDPERGASKTKEAEVLTRGMQRIRSIVLLGTAILGDSRYAILEPPADVRPSPAKAPAGSTGQLRLKLGDSVEGFRLSEIHEQKIIFTKGAARVEVPLDYSRRVEEPRVKPVAPAPPRPTVGPRVPTKEAGPTKPDR